MKKRVMTLLPLLLLALTGCEDDETGLSSDLDPPATVQDLVATSPSDTLIILTWTAPGDDGLDGRASQYVIRCTPDPLSPTTWPFATAVTPPATMRSGGDPESVAVRGIPHGRWQFALKSADDNGNWSRLSNVASAPSGDLLAPARVADLSATSTTGTSVTLTWTAPGDNGTAGRATRYDIRYALAPIAASRWDQAAQAANAPAPGVPGATDSVTISDLDIAKTYYFALRTADDFPNWSLQSNTATAITGLRRLTTSPGSSGFGAQFPDWSPDGMSIVFVADWNGANVDIYTISAAGGDAVRLTTDHEVDTYPSWSPDGRKVAFTSHRGGKGELWVMDAASGGGPTLIASHAQDVLQSTWSPDGSHISYAAETYPPYSALYIVPSAGGDHELLYNDPSQNLHPAWCPDTTRIAFTSDRHYSQDIWTVRAREGATVRLTFMDTDDASPSWSPTAERIAFQSDRSGNLDIWTMASDGTNPVRLTFDSAKDFDPAWSPDGSRIAFTSRRSGQAEIWIQDLE
jgi:hypothetical protein